MTGNVRQVIHLGMFAAAAAILSVIDLRITLFAGMPGLKLGLANMATLVALAIFDARAVFLIVVSRVCLGALLGGGGFGPAFAVSFSAGIASTGIMLYGYRRWQPCLSIVGISVAGAIVHNFVQLTVAALLLDSSTVYHYLPYMTLAGTLTGAVIGCAAMPVTQRLRHCC